MGQKEKESIIIFSVFRKNQNTEHNTDVHETVKVQLTAKNIGFKELLSFDGEDNKLSFLVLANQENVVKSLCNQFNQDVYLYSGPERETSYVDKSGVKREMGTLQRIHPSVLNIDSSYMYDFEDHSFWAIK
jgi:hypothetical protein